MPGQSRSADQQLAEDRRPTRRPTYREFLLGAIFPVLITVVLSPIDDSAKYRPTSLLLLGCVVAAVIAGMRAAVVCAALSAIALWWGFTEPTRSWHVLTTADAVGIGVFVAAVAGVILLVHRLDEVRQSERLDRAETGLDWHWNTTQNLVPRRQAQRLMQLSESLTTAVDEQQIAEYVCSFLIDTFDGRATVALLEGDLLVVAALAGFGPDEIAGIIGSRVMLHDDSPMAEAARTNALVVQLGRVNIDEGRPEPNTTWSDLLEQTSVSMPLSRRPSGRRCRRDACWLGCTPSGHRIHDCPCRDRVLARYVGTCQDRRDPGSTPSRVPAGARRDARQCHRCSIDTRQR